MNFTKRKREDRDSSKCIPVELEFRLYVFSIVLLFSRQKNNNKFDIILKGMQTSESSKKHTFRISYFFGIILPDNLSLRLSLHIFSFTLDGLLGMLSAIFLLFNL